MTASKVSQASCAQKDDGLRLATKSLNNFG